MTRPTGELCTRRGGQQELLDADVGPVTDAETVLAELDDMELLELDLLTGRRDAEQGSSGMGAAHLYPDCDAITLAETLEASWSEAELLDLIQRHPQIGVNVIRIIGRRLQEVQERVRELATQRAERRVAHAVLRLARQAGHSSIDGTAIEFPLRRKDLADIAGTTLHTASRILTEKAGFLATRNQRLTIRQPLEILRIAEDTSD